MAKKKMTGAHSGGRAYYCEKCIFVFTIFKDGLRSSKLFCPSCGENMDTRRHYGRRHKLAEKKLILTRWKTKELVIMNECLEGKYHLHEVAEILGRTLPSVDCKLRRMRREKENAGNPSA